MKPKDVVHFKVSSNLNQQLLYIEASLACSSLLLQAVMKLRFFSFCPKYYTGELTKPTTAVLIAIAIAAVTATAALSFLAA